MDHGNKEIYQTSSFELDKYIHKENGNNFMNMFCFVVCVCYKIVYLDFSLTYCKSNLVQTYVNPP